MTKCEKRECCDCFHYEACKAMLEAFGLGDYVSSASHADRCPDFVHNADVAPVRHGRWLFVTNGQMTSAWCCSECGRTVAITCDEELRQSKLEKEYPFCHCGAKMDLERITDGKG